MWLKMLVDFGTVDRSGLKFKMSKNKVKCVGKTRYNFTSEAHKETRKATDKTKEKIRTE